MNRRHLFPQRQTEKKFIDMIRSESTVFINLQNDKIFGKQSDQMIL
jgi:hypothetical protein